MIRKASLSIAASVLFSASALAQQPTPADMPQELIWVDRAGKILGTVGDAQPAMYYPRLSPDGRFIAVSALGDEGKGGRSIWVHDVEHGTRKKTTVSGGNNNFPVWSPDGKRIAYTSSSSGTYQLQVVDLESGKEDMLLKSDTRQFPNDWSADARLLCYTEDRNTADPVHNLVLLRMDESPSTSRELLKKPPTWYDSAVFSPDGNYLAYASTASGPWEVHVVSLKDPGQSWQVSRGLGLGWAGGGGQPRWRADGKELFYMMGNDTMMSVGISTEGAFTPGKPVKLFTLTGMKGNFPDETPWRHKYDVTRDGQRFVFVRTRVSSTSPSAQAPAPAVTVFEGARVIVGDGSAIENATFIVDGGRFVQVGRTGDGQIPAGAARVSLAGKTVMPAIIDTHTHLSRERPALVEDLQRRAYYGIGAAMSLGQDKEDVPFQVRAETIPGGARYRTAGRGITRPEPGRTDLTYWINTADEARKAVQEQAARKVDFIKVWVDDRDGKYQKLTPELYGAVIDEAHKHNLRVTAHIFMLEDAKGLLRAGLDAFAHGVRDKDVDDEFVQMVRQRPTVVLVPNLPDRGVVADYGWLRGSIPDGEMQKLQAAATDRPDTQRVFGIQARNLARLNAAGMKIAVGTDGNTPWAPHVEMADMVAAGMTPAQVLVAATRNGAELLGLTDAGTVATGKSADFIVLDANPLDDITNTRKISAVYLRGTAVNRGR